jgi:predicted ATPase
MITAIRLENFKCFELLKLDVAPLTLLTGFNASGKSSTLQSLLLLAQTMRAETQTSELRLNGPLLNLGSPGDVINQNTSRNDLTLGIQTPAAEMLWTFGTDEVDDRRSFRATHLRTRAGNADETIHSQRELRGLLPFGEEIPEARELVNQIIQTVFLSAVRQVDTDVFPMLQDVSSIPADVGTIGQFAAWWLHYYDDAEVDARRRLKGTGSSNTLRSQVNSWASDLFNSTEINSQPLPRTNLMRLEFKTGRRGDWRRPSNIGYGITYAFPVLVAGLHARSGQTVIVDSPEAHLHPRGQSRMGYFLGQVASSGAQMIVETHSDHVLNGVRIALRDGIIPPDSVAIYFFRGPEGPQVIRVAADKAGSLSDLPEGFFDQSEKDLAVLAGWT